MQPGALIDAVDAMFSVDTYAQAGLHLDVQLR